MSDALGEILNGTLNGAVGSAQGREGTSFQTFVISLGAGFVLFAVQFSIFLIIRRYRWSKRIYQPRSFLVSVSQRMKPPHSNPFLWIAGLFKIKEDPHVLQKAGMDAYFFLRYLSMCLKIFFPIAFFCMPILITLNVKQGKGGEMVNGNLYNVSGLDRLAWSNIRPENTNRYWAHLVLAVGSIAWVCFIFHEELLHYIRKRHEFLKSPSHRLKASATTVLIMDMPSELCSEQALLNMYGDFPGGIRRIWLNRNLSPLVELDESRRRYEGLLENATTNMLRKAGKKHSKKPPTSAISMGSLSPKPPTTDEDSPIASNTLCPDTTELTPAICTRDLMYDLNTKAMWTEYLSPKQRPKMRIPHGQWAKLSKIPLLGMLFTTKVDTIYYCRRQLANINREFAEKVKEHESCELNKTAFIQFNHPKAAQIACQSLADTEPRHMKKRIVEMAPGDINWENLNVTWRSRYIRMVSFLLLYLCLLFVFGLIAFFTGILSKISTISGSTSWLRWVDSLPSWLLSCVAAPQVNFPSRAGFMGVIRFVSGNNWVTAFIQGTVPTFTQIIVLSGPLPILMRAMTNGVRASTTGSEGERSLQLWYLIFLVFELFLVPTISSGLTSIINTLIKTPQSTPNILATNLPTASNYYFSFLILQALSLSSTSLLQTVRLFQFYVAGSVNTPDSVYQKLSWTHRTRIGSNIPWYTTFAVIGLVYAIVAPFILILCLMTFSIFWLVIKNQVLYVVRTGDIDSGGVWFPSAINQIFTGLYFMEICLIGLFFLVKDENNDIACEAQGIIMAVVLVGTVLYQIWLMVHLGRLFKYAPVRLDAEATELLANGDLFEEPASIDEPERADPEKHRTEQAENWGSEDSGTSGSATAATADREGSASPPKDSSLPVPAAQSRRATLTTQTSRDLVQRSTDEKAAKGILARFNRPFDEANFKQLEKTIQASQKQLGHVLLPNKRDIEQQMLDDPISKIILELQDELETLDPVDRDHLIGMAFLHPVLRAPSPCVWIPRDELGISDDEIKRTRAFSDHVSIENKGAFFAKGWKVRVDDAPPDQSKFALILPQL